MQKGLKMETGDCPSLNMNDMRKISVKTLLKLSSENQKFAKFPCSAVLEKKAVAIPVIPAEFPWKMHFVAVIMTNSSLLA